MNLFRYGLFVFVIFLGFFVSFGLAGAADVEFNEDSTLDLTGVSTGDIQAASGSKAAKVTVSGKDLTVDGVPDGESFQVKTSAHTNGLKVSPSSGTSTFSFNTDNISSGNIDQWTLTATSGVSASITWGVGKANTSYVVSVDGSEWNDFTSNGSSELVFSYSDFSSRVFTLTEGSLDSGGSGNTSSAPPEYPLEVHVSGDSETTSSSEVTLDLVVGGNVQQMDISNSPDFESGETKTFSFEGTGVETLEDQVSWNLCFPDDSCKEGDYAVYVRFESYDGIVSDTVSDSVSYETDTYTEKDKKDEEGDVSEDKEQTTKTEDEDEKSGDVGFSSDLSLGSTGEKVRQLQTFLNENGFVLASEGPGSPGQETDYFGPLTRRALVKFQELYSDDILEPAGLSKGTGYFGSLTREFVNDKISRKDEIFSYNFTSFLRRGDRGSDVRALQKALDIENCFDYPEYTGYYGAITERGVMCFQEKYREEVLDPWDLDEGTGYFGPTSMGKMDELY